MIDLTIIVLILSSCKLLVDDYFCNAEPDVTLVMGKFVPNFFSTRSDIWSILIVWSNDWATILDNTFQEVNIINDQLIVLFDTKT